MPLAHGSDATLALNSEHTRDLAQLGIICVPIDNFYYREFHYTKLEDAIAQMDRDRKRNGLSSASSVPARA